MRRPVKNRNIPKADPIYNSVKVEKFINCFMYDGKKEAARKVVYGAFDLIKEMEKVEDPIPVFEAAFRNVGPSVEVRSRRVGGANYQVPREVRPERRVALATRWIREATRSKKGNTAKSLAEELIAASKNEGSAFKKKEDTHRMAEANRAFAHFAW